MTVLTPKYGFSSPLAAEANAAGTDLGLIATAADSKISELTYGNVSARPAAGIDGRLYYAMDEAVTYIDTGAAWKSLALPTIPLARYYRSVTTAYASPPGLVVIAWNATSHNRNGMPTAATKLVAPVAGWYRISAQARFNVGTSGGGAANQCMQIRTGPNSDTAGTSDAFAQACSPWDATGGYGFDNDSTVRIESVVKLAAGGDAAVWFASSHAESAAGNGLYAGADLTFVDWELVAV